MEQPEKSSTESNVVDIKPRGMSVGKKKRKKEPVDHKTQVVRTLHKAHKDAAGGKVRGALLYLEFKDGNSKSLVVGEYDVKEMVFYLEYMKTQLLKQVK